jgi:hypothetical protein
MMIADDGRGDAAAPDSVAAMAQRALAAAALLLLLSRPAAGPAAGCSVALGTFCATAPISGHTIPGTTKCEICAGRNQAPLRRAGCAHADIEEWCSRPELRVDTYDPSTGKFLRDFQSWSWGGVEVAARRRGPGGGSFAISVPCGTSAALQVHGPLVLGLGDLQALELLASGSGTDISVVLQNGAGSAVGASVSLRDAGVGFTGLNESARSFRLPFTAFAVADPSTKVHMLQLRCEANPQVQGGGVLLLSGLAYSGFPPRPSALPVAVALSPAPKRRGEQPRIAREVYGVNFGAREQLSAVGYTVNRWGGNAAGTRYAWDIDTTNRAKDWYFESLPDR